MAHADDFADRPLPYRVFLNKAYNDDGLEASYLFGSSEIGFGIFRERTFLLVILQVVRELEVMLGQPFINLL